MQQDLITGSPVLDFVLGFGAVALVILIVATTLVILRSR